MSHPQQSAANFFSSFTAAEAPPPPPPPSTYFKINLYNPTRKCLFFIHDESAVVFSAAFPPNPEWAERAALRDAGVVALVAAQGRGCLRGETIRAWLTSVAAVQTVSHPDVHGYSSGFILQWYLLSRGTKNKRGDCYVELSHEYAARAPARRPHHASSEPLGSKTQKRTGAGSISVPLSRM